ncbi:hypothetical protein EIP86_007520 [Pleurotus ostreatoroseus]|nr:hypothetical protein EIP86_007520 [Pleurotus ostreatoroseus]
MNQADPSYTPVEGIKGLARLLQENVVPLEDAILADLGKQRQECTLCETGPLIESCLYAAEHLEEWTKPEKPQVEAWRSSWETTVFPVPKGVSLIISPWNYPYILTFNPLVGAIAAGCPVVMKPAELTPTCSALMASLVAKYLDSAAYTVVLGAVHETEALLAHRWAHIFFTGSTRVGRIIAAKAGEHLTPVTLELGGKSPVVIDEDCDLALAAKRVLFGKVQNSGQLCVSPDYVLVPRSVASQFKDALKKEYQERFPSGALHPDIKWSNIINPAHFRRLKNLLDRSKGKILIGGEVDGEKRMAPTIVTDVKLDDALMEEEIFGPILPVVDVEDVEEAMEIINNGATPLALYVFSNRQGAREEFVDRTNSGSLVFNDTFIQISSQYYSYSFVAVFDQLHRLVHEVPFGGHGESGYGNYYSKDTFNAFTHRRSSINVPPSFEPNFGFRYLPYTDESYKVMTASARAKIPEA